MPRAERSCRSQKKKEGWVYFSSFPSSSSELLSYRLRKGFIVEKRRGTSTPSSPWRTEAPSSCSVSASAGCSQSGRPHAGGSRNQAPVSARKLGGALWELKAASARHNLRPGIKEPARERGTRRRDSPSPSTSATCPVSERCHKWRMPEFQQKIRLCGRDIKSASCNKPDDDRPARMEVYPAAAGPASCLKDVKNSLMASKALLRALRSVWGVDKQRSPASSLILGLHLLLDRACVQADQLAEERASESSEMRHLIKSRFLQEANREWRKKKVQERRTAPALSQDEPRLQVREAPRSESRLNRKIRTELIAEARAELVDVKGALRREKRWRMTIEQICMDLIKEIEELKREAAVVGREEPDRKRQVLQLKDGMLPETYRLKSSEAKLSSEKKHRAAKQQTRDEILPSLAEREDDDVSATDSDLRSIVLNMGRGGEGDTWTYVAGSHRSEMK